MRVLILVLALGVVGCCEVPPPRPPGPALVGGDMNCGFYGIDFEYGSDFDQTMEAFEERGWVDAHLFIDPADRVTSPEHNFILDIIVGTEDVFSAPGICPEVVCGGLSDHLPVWTTVKIN